MGVAGIVHCLDQAGGIAVLRFEDRNFKVHLSFSRPSDCRQPHGGAPNRAQAPRAGPVRQRHQIRARSAAHSHSIVPGGLQV